MRATGNISAKKQQEKMDIYKAVEGGDKPSHLYQFLLYLIDCAFSKDNIRAKKWRRTLANIRYSPYLPYAKWGAVVFLLFCLHLFFLRDGLYERLYNKGHDMARDGSALIGFQVKKLRINGLENLQEQDIISHLENAHNIKSGTPILFIDIEELQESITQFGWVKQAMVQRILPTILDIQLQERTPIAIWKRGDDFTLIDIDGEAISGDDLHQFSHLPLVTGDGVTMHMHDLQALLTASPHLSARIKAASWLGNRRWDIYFDNGIKAMLPDNAPLDAWLYLEKIDRENHLLSRKIKVVDLRLSEQMILQKK